MRVVYIDSSGMRGTVPLVELRNRGKERVPDETLFNFAAVAVVLVAAPSP